MEPCPYHFDCEIVTCRQKTESLESEIESLKISTQKESQRLEWLADMAAKIGWSPSEDSQPESWLIEKLINLSRDKDGKISFSS